MDHAARQDRRQAVADTAAAADALDADHRVRGVEGLVDAEEEEIIKQTAEEAETRNKVAWEGEAV